MGKRRRKSNKDDKEITFDAKERFEYLTGFTKRKNERRRKAVKEILERERKDRIEVKKERRDDIKKRFKEITWAEKRAERLADKLAERRKKLLEAKALKNGHGGGSAGALEDASSEASETERRGRGYGAAALEDAPLVVAFVQEDADDDPFGGVEVVASALDEHSTGGGSELALATSSTLRSIVARGGKDGERGEGGDSVALIEGVRPEELQLARARRAKAAAKDEAKRLKYLEKNVTKRIALNKELGKKHPKKVKVKSKGQKRTGIKYRRKRAKQKTG